MYYAGKSRALVLVLQPRRKRASTLSLRRKDLLFFESSFFFCLFVSVDSYAELIFMTFLKEICYNVRVVFSKKLVS